MKEKERSSRTKKGERTIIQNDAEEINEEMKEVKIKEDEKGKRMEEKERRMRENRKENFQKNEGGIILMKTRYSELLILHQELEKQFGAENLPPFPPKKCLGNQKEDFIERRKRLLEVYFNRLALKIDLRKEKIINRFIENHQESFNGPEKLVKLKLDNHQQKKETITNEDNIMRSQVFEEKDNEGKDPKKSVNTLQMMNLSLQRGLSQKSELKRRESIKLEEFLEEEGGRKEGGEGREKEEEKRREDFLRDYQGWRIGQLELKAFLLSYDLVETKRNELILKKIRIVGRREDKEESRKQEKEKERKSVEENEERIRVKKEGYEESWIVFLSKKKREFYELKIMEFFKDSAISYFALQPLLLYYYRYLISPLSSPSSSSSASSSFTIKAFYSERYKKKEDKVLCSLVVLRSILSISHSTVPPSSLHLKSCILPPSSASFLQQSSLPLPSSSSLQNLQTSYLPAPPSSSSTIFLPALPLKDFKDLKEKWGFSEEFQELQKSILNSESFNENELFFDYLQASSLYRRIGNSKYALKMINYLEYENSVHESFPHSSSPPSSFFFPHSSPPSLVRTPPSFLPPLSSSLLLPLLEKALNLFKLKVSPLITEELIRKMWEETEERKKNREKDNVWRENEEFLRQLTRLTFKFFICLDEPAKAWEILYQNEKRLSEKLGRKFNLYMAILSRKTRKYKDALKYVNLMLDGNQKKKEENDKDKETASQRDEEAEGWRGEGLEERGRIFLAMGWKVNGLEELRKAVRTYYLSYENFEEEIARVKQLIGEKLIEMEDYEEALVALDESLAIKKSISFTKPQNLTSLYLLLGKCQIGLKNFSIAKDFLKLVLHKKEEGKREEGEGKVRRKENEGMKRRDVRGRREELEERGETEKEDRREEIYDEGEARFLKAYIQFEDNNWNSVRKNARKGLKIMKKAAGKSSIIVADLYLLYAKASLFLMDHVKAKHCLLRALPLYRLHFGVGGRKNLEGSRRNNVKEKIIKEKEINKEEKVEVKNVEEEKEEVNRETSKEMREEGEEDEEERKNYERQKEEEGGSRTLEVMELLADLDLETGEFEDSLVSLWEIVEALKDRRREKEKWRKKNWEKLQTEEEEEKTKKEGERVKEGEIMLKISLANFKIGNFEEAKDRMNEAELIFRKCLKEEREEERKEKLRNMIGRISKDILALKEGE